MANIKDVAKLAGVSVSTVSNILNQKISVSQELHQRVIQAMQELDYHPNFLAMNLRKKSINFVGVIVSSLSGHYHQIYDGINQIAREARCQPILKIAKSPKEEHRQIEELLQLNVSGIIIISSNLDRELIRHYTEADVPVVFADFYPTDSEHNTVRFDNYHIIRDLTQSLMAAGKQTALITGNSFLGSEQDCIRAYLESLNPAVQREGIMFQTEFNKESIFADLMNFICSMDRVPESIIVSSANLAKTVSEICSLLKMEGIRIYALSGDSWYSHREDSISYLRRKAILCGMEAAELLLRNIKNPITFDTRQITVELHDRTLEEPDYTCLQMHKPEELKLLMLRSNISDAVEKLSRNFSANTGIRISVTTASQQELERIIRSDADNKTSEYDIIMADMHWMQQLKQEHVFRRLNDLLPMESIMPRYVREVRNYILSEADGQDIYALPILVGHQMLAYRSDLFEDPLLKKKLYLKYGVELQVPRTWNEFNLIARFFTRQQNPDSPVEYGTCLVGQKNNGILSEFLPRQWSFGGRFLDRGRLDLASVANLKAVKNLRESFQCSYPDCGDFMEEEQIQAFSQGKIAMICTYNVHLQDNLDFSEGNVQFAKLPGSQALIGGWMLGISAYSKNPSACAEFLKWEICDKISIHSALLGQVSPFKNVFFDKELLTVYPWMKVANEKTVSLRGKELCAPDFHSGSAQVQLEQAFSQGLWDVLGDKISPEVMLRQLQEEHGELFEK